MGTDISLYVQRRTEQGWKTIFPDPSLHLHLHGDYYTADVESWAWYSGRNYELFALLADVRNYSKNHSPWAHRGLPPDFFSDSTHGHSHTWASLKELLDFDWENEKIKFSAYMNPTAYQNWRETGQAHSFCRGRPMSDGSKEVSSSEMNEMIANGAIYKHTWRGPNGEHSSWLPKESGTHYYTYVTWTEPAAETCQWFVKRTLPAISEATHDSKPEDVRLVYWFDC